MWQHGDWMMDHGWGWGMWLMPFGGFWFLILIAVVIAVFFLRSPRHPYTPRTTALDLLEQRYAKGEIEREEYLRKKADLLGHGGA